MQPFERLRSVARRGGDDDAAVVTEAADCLSGFGDDPAGLVMACRQLLHHHPASGPLWWLCARVLTAPDSAEMALDSWELLHEDRTAERLASRLPFPHDEPVAILGWSDTVGEALAERPDLDAFVVRVPNADPRMHQRMRRSEHPVRVVDAIEAGALSPSHALVEARAAGPTTALVAAGSVDLLDELDARVTVWLVAGAGRVLPERLFAAMRTASAHARLEEVPLERFDRVAGPAGLDPPDRVPRRVDCPVAPELLRLGI
jgi:hypothetical protein